MACLRILHLLMKIDKSYSYLQLERFSSAIKNVPYSTMKHAANSAAALAIPESHYDAIRPGLSLYGIYPGNEKPIPLEPAITWKTRISWIEDIEAGEGVSYGLTYKATSRTRIAGIQVGYGDGYPRALSNRRRSVDRRETSSYHRTYLHGFDGGKVRTKR